MMLRRNTKDPMTMHMADGGVTRWANGLRMADGGNYRKGSMNGGRVVGPGTGVSDSVPARYSNGEYVLPADTAAAIGHDRLDAIKDATHTPAAVQHGLDVSGGMGGLRGLRSDQTVRLADDGMPDFARRLMGTPNDVANQPFLDAAKQRVDPVQTAARNAAYVQPTAPAAPSFPESSPSPKWLNSGGVVPQPAAASSPLPQASPAAPVAPEAPAAPRTYSATSNEAKTYNDSRAAPAGAAPAAEAAPTTLRGKASSFLGSSFKNITSAVKTIGPGLAAGIAGGAAASAVRTLGDPSKSPGQPQDIGAASQIPTGGDGAAPTAQPYNFFTDNEVGRNIGNTLTASQPFGGSVSAGLRALGTGGKITARLAGVSDLAGAAGLGAAADIQSQRAAAANPVAVPAAAASPVGTLTPGDATMPGQDPGRGPLLRGMSGTDVRGAPGVSKFTQDGKTLYSNVSTPGDNDALMNGRAGVSTVPGMSRQAIDAVLGGQSAGQTSADNQIRAANLRDGVDMERGTSQEVADRAAAQQEALARSPLGTPGRAFAQKQMIAKQEQDVLRRGQDITERDNVRTNDTSLRNNKMNNDFNAGKFQVEMGQKDREFGASERAANMTARSASESQLQKNLESQFRKNDDKGNNVPDEEKIGQYRTAVAGTLLPLAKELEATGNPAAIAKAKELRTRGPSALEDGDYARLKTLFDQRSRLAESRGKVYNTGTFKDSDNLLDFTQKNGAAGTEKRFLGGNRVVTRNGSSASVNDLRYKEGPANYLIPDLFKPETDNLTRGMRRE